MTLVFRVRDRDENQEEPAWPVHEITADRGRIIGLRLVTRGQVVRGPRFMLDDRLERVQEWLVNSTMYPGYCHHEIYNPGVEKWQHIRPGGEFLYVLGEVAHSGNKSSADVASRKLEAVLDKVLEDAPIGEFSWSYGDNPKLWEGAHATADEALKAAQMSFVEYAYGGGEAPEVVPVRIAKMTPIDLMARVDVECVVEDVVTRAASREHDISEWCGPEIRMELTEMFREFFSRRTVNYLPTEVVTRTFRVLGGGSGAFAVEEVKVFFQFHYMAGERKRKSPLYSTYKRAEKKWKHLHKDMRARFRKDAIDEVVCPLGYGGEPIIPPGEKVVR